MCVQGSLYAHLRVFLHMSQFQSSYQLTFACIQILYNEHLKRLMRGCANKGGWRWRVGRSTTCLYCCHPPDVWPSHDPTQTGHVDSSRWQTRLPSPVRVLSAALKSCPKLESNLCWLNAQPSATDTTTQWRADPRRSTHIKIQTLGRLLRMCLLTSGNATHCLWASRQVTTKLTGRFPSKLTALQVRVPSINSFSSPVRMGVAKTRAVATFASRRNMRVHKRQQAQPRGPQDTVSILVDADLTPVSWSSYSPYPHSPNYHFTSGVSPKGPMSFSQVALCRKQSPSSLISRVFLALLLMEVRLTCRIPNLGQNNGTNGAA